MTRSINPVPQYFANFGEVCPGGRMFYYKTGTKDLKDIYVNVEMTIRSRNPVILDANGRLPDVYFEGRVKQVFEDCHGVQVWERDPVDSGGLQRSFDEWDENVSYSQNQTVEGSDENYYRSLQDNNIGNDPTTSPEFWNEIEFLEYWNSSIVYDESATVKTTDGLIWSGLDADNLNNDPATTGFWRALGADAFAYVDNFIVQAGFGVQSVQDAGNVANVIFEKTLTTTTQQTVYANALTANRVYYVNPSTIGDDRAGVQANTYNQVVVAPDGPFFIARFVQ